MERIIKRIKKLISLSTSPNEYEAQSAMLKAQEMLARHKLTMREIDGLQDDSDVIEINTHITFRVAKWKAQLAEVIANNFGCKTFYYTYRSHSIVFIGQEADARIAEVMFTYAVDCIDDSCKKIISRYAYEGYSTKGIKNDFAMGFIAGLNDQFERQKQNNQEWGLVLITPQEVQQKYQNMNFKGSLDTSTKYEGFQEVYDRGLEEGEKFGINRIKTEDELEQMKIG